MHPFAWIVGWLRAGGHGAVVVTPISPGAIGCMANPPYQRASISPVYQRQIVQYPRREAPGSVLVETAGPFVYYVLPGGKAIRYGATVGEEGQAWSGVATVGRKAEWPGWTPTEDMKRRLGPLPNYVEGGVHNPMGARAIYLYAGGKDTMYRIHGTNQPEYIGHAISSGCIRITNEDVIDLYSRVEMGATVVVLDHRSDRSVIASAGRVKLRRDGRARLVARRSQAA